MKSFRALAIVCLTLTSPTLAFAGGRCPAGVTGCTLDNAADKIRDRVDEGREKVMETRNPFKQVDEVGKTILDCARCGGEAIQDGATRAVH
jgi:hypothetical protein